MRLRIATIAASLRFVFANAGIAQLVEQLICNQQVVGSNPTAGSITSSVATVDLGAAARHARAFSLGGESLESEPLIPERSRLK